MAQNIVIQKGHEQNVAAVNTNDVIKLNSDSFPKCEQSTFSNLRLFVFVCPNADCSAARGGRPPYPRNVFKNFLAFNLNPIQKCLRTKMCHNCRPKLLRHCHNFIKSRKFERKKSSRFRSLYIADIFISLLA